jgi:hypothetical protein
MSLRLTAACVIVATFLCVSHAPAEDTLHVRGMMPSETFTKAGLSKLTADELAVLDQWMTSHTLKVIQNIQEEQAQKVLYPHDLEGAWIVANDGKPLGLITANEFNSDSLLNEFGEYGNEFNSDSIFNEFGPYGNEFSSLSPFNEFTSTPPIIVRNGKILGYFTANSSLTPRIDPRVLIGWLKRP